MEMKKSYLFLSVSSIYFLLSSCAQNYTEVKTNKTLKNINEKGSTSLFMSSSFPLTLPIVGNDFTSTTINCFFKNEFDYDKSIFNVQDEENLPWLFVDFHEAEMLNLSITQTEEIHLLSFLDVMETRLDTEKITIEEQKAMFYKYLSDTEYYQLIEAMNEKD